jgi:hypothetical protein
MKTHKMKIKQSLMYAVVLVSSVLLSSPVHAEPDKTIEAAEKNSPESIEHKVVSVVTADWNNDKRIDSAVLLKSGDQVDLYIYFGNATANERMVLTVTKKNIVWSGALDGTLPHLSVDKTEGLLIHSENDAIGRDRWHQQLNVNYRDNDFLVSGYVYDAHDTLDPKADFSCDVNLLTGKGVKDKKPFKIAGQKIKLIDWSDEKIPKQCRNQ